MIDAFSVVSFAHERRREGDGSMTSAAQTINVYARKACEAREDFRVFRRADRLVPLHDGRSRNFASRSRNHWPRRRGGGNYQTRVRARLWTVGFSVQRTRMSELHRYALQMRRGNCVS